MKKMRLYEEGGTDNGKEGLQSLGWSRIVGGSDLRDVNSN